MQPLITHEGLVLPLDRSDVDTDAILPKQFMKTVRRSGFAPYLFDEWRYLDRAEYGADCSLRELNKDFVLNYPKYSSASILMARRNFGCGSSREHAPWALLEYGFRVIVAESFADIFKANCIKIGLLPITLDGLLIDKLMSVALSADLLRLHVDVESCIISVADKPGFAFSLSPEVRENFLGGLDDISQGLRLADKIRKFESLQQFRQPWLY